MALQLAPAESDLPPKRMPQHRHAHPEQVAGTVPQCARKFGIGVKLLHQLVDEGEIPAYSLPKYSNRRLVFFGDVERYLRREVVAPRGSRVESRVREVLDRERGKTE